MGPLDYQKRLESSMLVTDESGRNQRWDAPLAQSPGSVYSGLRSSDTQVGQASACRSESIGRLKPALVRL